jgi:hypothetical protein
LDKLDFSIKNELGRLGLNFFWGAATFSDALDTWSLSLSQIFTQSSPSPASIASPFPVSHPAHLLQSQEQCLGAPLDKPTSKAQLFGTTRPLKPQKSSILLERALDSLRGFVQESRAPHLNP